MNHRAKNHPYVFENPDPLPMKLGINGAGRIGKLTIWHHVARRSFRELVVNIGREVGTGIEDILEYMTRDSTYGPLSRYLNGFRGSDVVEDVDEKNMKMVLNGTSVSFLTQARNPKDIAWADHGVELVVECTGAFRDPNEEADARGGSLRGHMEAGARKVVLSAPFKIKDAAASMPEDAITAIMGINNSSYRPEVHRIVSGASCTTTCLAYMMKPLLDAFGKAPFLGASMVTVHAATGSQEVLDRLPKAGSDDLRKNRAVFNNVILTTTGAAKALGLVLPEIKEMGFTSESVRIPTNTGSLIILTLSIQNERGEDPVTPLKINDVYRDAAQGNLSRYLSFTTVQNVSSDIIGTAAAAIIEGRETRAYTAPVEVTLNPSCKIVPESDYAGNGSSKLQIPVSQVVVYGWYDNELGSYTNMLGELTLFMARGL